MTTLHAAAHPGLPLAEALATCVRASKLAEATALLTAPSRYDIALVGADGGCRPPRARPNCPTSTRRVSSPPTPNSAGARSPARRGERCSSPKNPPCCPRSSLRPTGSH